MLQCFQWRTYNWEDSLKFSAFFSLFLSFRSFWICWVIPSVFMFGYLFIFFMMNQWCSENFKAWLAWLQSLMLLSVVQRRRTPAWFRATAVLIPLQPSLLRFLCSLLTFISVLLLVCFVDKQKWEKILNPNDITDYTSSTAFSFYFSFFYYSAFLFYPQYCYDGIRW